MSAFARAAEISSISIGESFHSTTQATSPTLNRRDFRNGWSGSAINQSTPKTWHKARFVFDQTAQHTRCDCIVGFG